MMKSASKKLVRVKFLYHKKAKDLFAYFLDEDEQPGYKTCYSLVGQHSLCSEQYANSCVNATPEQYDVLKTELEELYDLEILN